MHREVSAVLISSVFLSVLDKIKASKDSRGGTELCNCAI